MSKSGPIIVIDDDLEDHMIFEEIFGKLNYPNKVIFFSDGNSAMEYLDNTEELPFIIISDINMPGMNGFEIRDRICSSEKLSRKCIPYLFFTTSVDEKAVKHAYDLCVQGYFMKPATMGDLQNTLRKIIDYWQESYAPSQFN
ncbi:MAG: response regulator [Bacteroidota bacterium]|nr:response regulator [Bacteroidota bacterium]